VSADPFSDVLKLASAEAVISGGLTAGRAWAIRFPPPDKLKFFAIVRGTCWLTIDGREDPIRVEPGDVFLVSRLAFVLLGDMAAIPVDASDVFTPASGMFAQLGAGDDFSFVGGHVTLDALSGGFFADVLPPLVYVRAVSPQATVLQWLLEQLVRERASDLPGASVVSEQLAQLMFVQILRAHLDDSGSLPAGLLRALGDAGIAPAIRLMHGDPGRPWKLQELAESAAMSRTTFALRFKNAAGVTPLTYLLNWRMRLAERALREGTTTVSALGESLGYTSESAFSNAFKRAIGIAPKRYRDARRRTAA